MSLAGEEVLIERGMESSLLRVSVRANPPANVIWKIGGREISKFDSHFQYHQDGSLQINKVGIFIAGDQCDQPESMS